MFLKPMKKEAVNDSVQAQAMELKLGIIFNKNIVFLRSTAVIQNYSLYWVSRQDWIGLKSILCIIT